VTVHVESKVSKTFFYTSFTYNIIVGLTNDNFQVYDNRPF